MVKMRIRRHILLTAAVFSFCLCGIFSPAYATKGIILSGGYGTRLQEGLAKEFPSLTGGSKPLVPVAEKPMINYNLEILSQAADVDEIMISTSRDFIDEHNTWFNSVGSSIVVNRNPSTSEIDSITGIYGGKPVTIVNQGETPGSTYSLSYALEAKAVIDDFVVLGGDTLCTDLDLSQFISAGKARGRSLIGVYEVPVSQVVDKPVVVTDAAGKVTEYEINPVDPGISEGKTDPSAGALIYWMPNSFRQLIKDFLSEGENPDQTRNIFPYAMGKGNDIYAYDIMPEVFDCNDIDVFKTANVVFAAQGKTKAQMEAILSSGQVTIGKRVGGTVTEILMLNFDLRLKLTTLILKISSPGEVTLSNILTYLNKSFVSELPIYSIMTLLKYRDKIESASASALDAQLAVAINWIEGLSDETSSVISYARPNILNAFFTEGLLDMICAQTGINIADISQIYGAFGMAGEYAYEYFMVVKTNDGKFHYFDADVLKEGMDPVSYNMASVVNMRKSLHTQDPSLTGSSFGSVTTDAGIPVEAKQHDKFGMNLPPAVPPEELLDQEIIDWWKEKYPADSSKVDFLSALEVTDLYDAATPIATLETMFGVPQATLLNMILDAHTITGTYPEVFDLAIKNNIIYKYKLSHFDAYTIWFKSFTLGKSNEELSKEYNTPLTAVMALVDYITAKVVPVNTIEQRVRSEWLAYFDAIKAILVFDPDNKYYEKLVIEVYIPHVKGSSLVPVTIKDVNNFLGYSEDWTTRFRLSNPDIGKELNDLNRIISVKVIAYEKRIFSILYDGLYAKVEVNKGSQSGRRTLSLDPYDKFEALGVLADKGAFSSSLLERAGGFTKNEINVVHIEKWYYQFNEITVYEITIQKTRTSQSRFLLHLQKKGRPGVQTAYDNLVKIQPQSVYNKLYGIGTDTYTGRTAFATDKASYSTEADLIKSGVSKESIKQYITRRLKIFTGATEGFSDGCWVITDPAAIGFIDKGNGSYEARIADASKINKGVAAADVSNFYKTDTKWQSYGIDLSVSGGAPVETYIYVEDGVTKTVNIEWIDGEIYALYPEAIFIAVRDGIKEGLFNGGLLSSWTGQSLPDNYYVILEWIGSGVYKDVYKVIYEGRVFVCGRTRKPDTATIAYQFSNVLIPAYNYWVAKVPKERIPVPKAGTVVVTSDGQEVYTMEYISGISRTDHIKRLRSASIQDVAIANICLREESLVMWMIWKATNRFVKDLNSDGFRYVTGELGQRYPKLVDFGGTELTDTSFGSLYEKINLILKFSVETAVSPKTEIYADTVEILLGFYDAMKLDGLSDTVIINLFKTEISFIDPAAVDEAVNIIQNGRPIEWLDNPEEDKEVPYKAVQRRALAKSLIDGSHGLLPETLHELFPGEEETIFINNIRGAYNYKDPVRDHYTIYLDVLIAGKEATVPVDMAVSNAGTAALRATFDANRQALYGISPKLAQKSLSGKDFEVLDQANTYISKNVIAEEYSGAPMSWSAYESLPAGDPERQPILKAVSDLYANLYDATNENAIQGLPSAVLNNPKDVLIYKLIEGRYFARPIDYAAITGPKTPAEMIDHYVAAIPDLLINTDTFLKPLYMILGRDFLINAAAASAYKNAINTYLSTLPEPGSINDILNKMGYSMDDAGYAALRDDQWEMIKGKPIMINGRLYTIPSDFNTVSEYEKLFEIINSALGEEAFVWDVRAFSERDLAKVMLEVLDQIIHPSTLELEALKILGINSEAELRGALNNFPYLTIPKGYLLTPKKIVSFLLMMSPTGTEFLTTVVNQLKLREMRGDIVRASEAATYFTLSESDFRSLASLGKSNNLPMISQGVYFQALHVIGYTGMYYLHELAHARLTAELDLFALQQGLEPLVIETLLMSLESDMVLEGYAQDISRKLFEKLNAVFKASLGGGYDQLFLDMAKAINVYSYDDSLPLVQQSPPTSPTIYLRETELYKNALTRYGSDTFAADFFKEYLLKFGLISVDDFIKNNTPHYVLKTATGKVVAISDIHGGYEQLVSTLINAGMIQRGGAFGDPNYFEMPTHIASEPLHKYTYIGGNSLLIFLGDSINKGEYSYETMMLINMLKRKTEVIEHWGNHEAYLFEAAHIFENAPNFFGLKSTLNTLQQFSTTDGIAAYIEKLLYKTDSPRASLEELLDDSVVSSARSVDYMLSGILEEMLSGLKVLSKVTMASGDSYLFVHAGITKRAWDKIKNAGSPEAILYKFNELVLTDTELFWDTVDSNPKDWINDPVLVSDICNRLKIKYIVAGHAKSMDWQKSPNVIGFVGAEVGGFKRIIGIDTIMSPAEAVGDLSVQGHALVINPDGSRTIVSSDAFPSPVIKSPARFNFLKDGKVGVIGADGAKLTIHRKVFRDWYCGQGELYSFPNEIGFLDLKEDVAVEYVVKSLKIPLAPEFTIFPDDLGSLFYFVGYPNAVDMYYLDKRIGRATFSLADSNQKIKIDTFAVEEALLPADLIIPKEVARGLVINAYKLNSDTVIEIVGKTWPPVDGKDPMRLLWEALDSLGPFGNKYLSVLTGEDSLGFRLCDVLDPRLKNASFTISPDGILLPGDTVISGTKDAPNLVRGGVPVITDGILPKDAKLEITDGGNNVKILTSKGTSVITLKELLDSVEAFFGAGIREFNLKLEGTDEVVSLRDRVVKSSGIDYNLDCHSPCPNFFVEQSEYYERGLKRLRWTTHYSSTAAVDIPGEFKFFPGGEVEMVAITRGNSPYVKGKFSTGALSTDLEISLVKWEGQFETTSLVAKVYYPYDKFIKEVLPALAPEVDGGRLLDLGGGNKMWFGLDVNDPKISGEGPMFKNLGGYSVDGVAYKNYIKLAALASQEIIILPNVPSVGIAIYDWMPDVVVDIGEIDESKIFGGRNLRIKQGVVMWSSVGEEEISIVTPVNKMTTEPTRNRILLGRFLDYVRTPAGGAAVFGGANAMVIFINYAANDEVTTEMLMGDLFGNAAFMGAWWVGGVGVQHLANYAKTAGNLAKIGVTGLSVAIAPISIFLQEYGTAFYTEWSRAEDVDARLLGVADSLVVLAGQRAWYDVLNSWGNFIFTENTFDGGNTKADLENTIANKLWDMEVKRLVGIGAVNDLTPEDEFLEKRKTFYLDNGWTKAKKYSDLYQEEIVNAIMEALYVNVAPSFVYWCTRYGCNLPFVLSDTAVLPVSAAEAAEFITNAVSSTHEKFANGFDAEPPIEAILGADVFRGKYSLPELFGLARQEVESIKHILENPVLYKDKIKGPVFHDDWVSLPNWGGYYLIPYNLAIPKCDEILSLLSNADFTSLGIYVSTFNASFESISNEYVDVKSFLVYPPASGTTAPTTLKLLDDDIFSGIMYHWEVKAHNGVAGYSLPSERWGFIGKD